MSRQQYAALNSPDVLSIPSTDSRLRGCPQRIQSRENDPLGIKFKMTLHTDLWQDYENVRSPVGMGSMRNQDENQYDAIIFNFQMGVGYHSFIEPAIGRHHIRTTPCSSPSGLPNLHPGRNTCLETMGTVWRSELRFIPFPFHFPVQCFSQRCTGDPFHGILAILPVG